MLDCERFKQYICVLWEPHSLTRVDPPLEVMAINSLL